MDKRDQRVPVKLASGANPTEVVFTPKELADVTRSAGEKDLAVSTYIREAAFAAAQGPVAKVKRAAKVCKLPLGAYLREVTLAAAGHESKPTDLPDHLARAQAWAAS